MLIQKQNNKLILLDIGHLDRDNGAAMFFIIKKAKETVLDFS